MKTEPCPGCQALLPQTDGPTHRYIGASPACWEIYTSLLSGEPPLGSGRYISLLVDAYAAQHPGTPSPQAIQSVAVHLLVLYGIFVRQMSLEQALWIRQRATRPGNKHSRYTWLTPPSFTGSLTVSDIAQAATPAARAELADRYVQAVWQTWSAPYMNQLSDWFERFIVK